MGKGKRSGMNDRFIRSKWLTVDLQRCLKVNRRGPDIYHCSRMLATIVVENV